jgi:hypothetical protein
MKDAYEVLYEKEAELVRVRREIASLTIAASLLGDGDLSFFDPSKAADGQNKKPAEKAISPPPDARATGTDSAPLIARRLGFWGSLKRKR